MSSLTVLLPALNEEKAIGLVIDEIRSLPVKYEILVIDNGSTDGTLEVLRDRGIEAIIQLKKGKGNAVRFGISHLVTPYVVMIDSDYTYPARQIPEIESLLDTKYDVVMGYRDTASMSRLNLLANRLLTGYASVLYRSKINDLCTGMWGFRTEVLNRFVLTSTGFTLEADLFVNSIRHAVRMVQIPIDFRPRLEGSNPKIKVWDGARIGWFLLKERFCEVFYLE